MRRTQPWPLVGTVAVTGLLAGAASVAGVFLRGDLATLPFTTVRGDTVDTLVAGVYRYNGQAVAAEGVGWDAVTLFLVVPGLFLLLPALRRGSVRATLAVMGILAYLLYQFVEYATLLAYGPLFLVYVAIFGVSLTGLALLGSRIDLDELAATTSARFPRRAMVAFGLFMAVLLMAMWLPLIARTFGAASVPALEGATTFVVQVFDLGLLVPLGLLTAATVHRRMPIGYVLAAITIVKGTTMGAAIAAMLVVEGLATGVTQVVPIALFAGISVVAATLAVRVFRAVGAGPAERTSSAPGEAPGLARRPAS